MRYVAWGRLRKDGDNDRVLGFLPAAFRPRENEEFLSLNWLEWFGGEQSSQIKASVMMFRKTMNVGSKSAFGIGNVRKIKEICRAHSISVRIVYEPKDDNSAHAGIRRLPRDDLALLEALAADAFVDLVHNAAIPQADSAC